MGLPDRWDACSRTIFLYGYSSVCAYWGNFIAVGLESDVVILDAITGTRASVLRGHKVDIFFLTCSLDGTLLLSGDDSGTFKLWDVQTGGTIKTFGNDKTRVYTASISPDNATIAFGCRNGTIYLSDVRTGKRHPIASAATEIESITFSPINPRRLLWTSRDGAVQQRGTDGRQIGASYRDADIKWVSDVAYTSDGTRFVICGGEVAVVWDSESGKQVVKLRVTGMSDLSRCCFSPDGKFVACAGGHDIYVWNISISGAPLVKRLVGHSRFVTFLAFSSSLISGSNDDSVKFWPTDSFLADSTTTGPAATSTSIVSAHLFHEDSAVVTSDSSGVVKTWDLITGICKSSFSTPAKGRHDTYLTGGTLIIVWWAGEGKEFHVWDVHKGQLLQTISKPLPKVMDIQISGDRPTGYLQGDGRTKAMSMGVGENTGRVGVKILHTRGSFFIHKSWQESGSWGRWGRWNPQHMRVSYPAGFQGRFRLDVVQNTNKIALCGIADTITKRMVFHFPERYADKEAETEWDGRYLLVRLPSGETMILDFDPVCP